MQVEEATTGEARRRRQSKTLPIKLLVVTLLAFVLLLPSFRRVRDYPLVRSPTTNGDEEEKESIEHRQGLDRKETSKTVSSNSSDQDDSETNTLVEGVEADDVEIETTLGKSPMNMNIPNTSVQAEKKTKKRSQTIGEEESNTEQSPALAFLESRRDAYHLANRTNIWALRGNGYLYTNHQIILEASWPETMTAGRNVITIRNVLQSPETIRSDCNQLILWVRVNGPEIFAGNATAIQPSIDEESSSSSSSCYWEFSFDLQVPGIYHVDVKTLLWNGLAPIIANSTESPCLTFQSNISDDIATAHPYHSGFLGFKMYRPALMCCEICSRLHGCRYWSTPPLNPQEKFGFSRNGCELYYDNNTTASLTLSHLIKPPTTSSQGRRRRYLAPLLTEHGYPYNDQETAYFVGCGWSYHFTLDFPCLSGDLDDRVFTARNNFTFAPSPRAPSSSLLGGDKIDTLPLCTLQDERVDRGRWVREAWPNAKTACTQPMQVGGGKKFRIMQVDAKNPLCWHRDDLSIVGNDCMEMNCKLIPDSSKWMSSLHQEKQWYGFWKPYGCDYYEFSNDQLQECIDKRKISSFVNRGASISAFLKEYLDFRLQNISLHDEGADSLTITLDTLSLLHLAHLPDRSFEKKMNELPVVASRTNEHYFVSGFFLSSEREVYAHVAKIHQLNQMAPDLLEPKGYRMINAYDMTAAFTYDTATQFDGMHIIGPPMKVIMYKLFHHVCRETVEGIRL